MGSTPFTSVEPQGLVKLVKGIRELEVALGDGTIEVTDSELEPRKSSEDIKMNFKGQKILITGGTWYDLVRLF